MKKETLIKYFTWLTLACLPAVSLFAQAKADLTQFVVLGEGLSAGFADFQLREIYQTNSFPALIARQAKVLFPQALIQSPGIGWVPGFQVLPALVPNTLQDTVRVPAAPAVTTRAMDEARRMALQLQMQTRSLRCVRLPPSTRRAKR